MAIGRRKVPVGHRDVNVWQLGLVGMGFLHEWYHWEEAGLRAWLHLLPPLCLQAGGRGAAHAQGWGRGHHGGYMELLVPGCSPQYPPVFSPVTSAAWFCLLFCLDLSVNVPDLMRSSEATPWVVFMKMM